MVEAVRILVALGFFGGFALYGLHAFTLGRALRKEELDTQQTTGWIPFVVAAGFLLIAALAAAALNLRLLPGDVLGLNVVLSSQMAAGIVLLIGMLKHRCPDGVDPSAGRTASGILLAAALATIPVAAMQGASAIGFQVQVAIAVNIGTIAAATSLLAWHVRARGLTGSALAANLAVVGANALVVFLFVRAALAAAPEDTQIQLRLVSGFFLVLAAGFAAPAFGQLAAGSASVAAEASRAATRPST
ncbi:MAG TPA: hypothetical protein VM889_01140 [Candidatus Thermoplasmatota archaeon]|nr:hypothetical protein [Candidatus Thermoplasmatota archaeon]